MTGKRPTISDVARNAGVSKATVSAVLNDTGAVRGSTRERVLAAIESLNYRPTQAAPSARRTGKSIGLVIKEHDNPYYGLMIDGVRAGVGAHGYTLLIVSTGGDLDTERRAVELLRGKDVDGLIVTPVLDQHAADLSHFFELKRRNFPFVLLEEVRGVPASLVDVDNVEASRQAVEHLIALGHTQIAHLAGPPYSAHSEQRVDGVRRAYSSSRLVFRDETIVAAGAHLEDGYRAGKALFGVADGQRPFTAVTCYNDLVAIGLLRALRELGLRVPEDVSIVGFDDVPLSAYVDPPLTTMRVPIQEMAETAARLLVRHIESKQAVPPDRVILKAQLVERGSTAAMHEPALSGMSTSTSGHGRR